MKQAAGPSQSKPAVPSGSESQATSEGQIHFKDPRVNPPKEFELHLRNKLSKKRSKCLGKCGKPISDKDFMIIRTYGSSTYTDKESGENKCKYGPLYIHFEGKCLKAFDSKKFYLPNENFGYSSIVVVKDTLDCLKPSEKNLISQMGVKLCYKYAGNDL